MAAAHELDAVPVTHRAVPAPRAPAERDLHERIQRDAIIRLRTGATANPGLLALLAGDRFAEIPAASDLVAAPYAPAATGTMEAPGTPASCDARPADPGGGPARGADLERARAVQRALAVPDLLCLIAPPGAALTLAVAEIVCAAAERGERVLIATPEPAAADPIVARLPPGRTLVRIDQAGGGPGTLPAAAADVQQRILARTQAAAHRLEPWLGDPSPARGWLQRLSTALAEAVEARERADQAEADRASTAAAARDRLGAPLRAAREAVEAAEQAAALAEDEVQRLAASLRKAECSRWGRWWAGLSRAGLSEAGLSRAGLSRPELSLAGRQRAGRLWAGLSLVGLSLAGLSLAGLSRAGRLHRRLAAASLCAETARAASVQARQLYEEREAHLDRAVEEDSAVRTAADRAAFADLAAHRALESAERSAHQLCRLLDGVSAEPEWAADAAGLAGFAAHCAELEPVLRARAALLREWRQQAGLQSRQLHAEVLRYADVVAATCLGVGRPEHGELEFDLVVIVDADRVPLPVALAPLVRARRAVLAGDVPARDVPAGDVPARDVPAGDVLAGDEASGGMAGGVAGGGVPAGETGHAPLRELPPGWVPDEVAALLQVSVLERVAGRAPAGNRVRLGARL